MAVAEGTSPERKSLEEVHGSIDIPPSGGKRQKLLRLFTFLGPAYLVSVGYMDPGNWATDLEGGARFGYTLIWVLLMSNLMAILLQTLAARLGVVTKHDLAQACRAEYSPRVNLILWILTEVAIAATDLAEVLGTIIALKLLFGLPLLWGCLITAFDTFALLYLQRWGMRQMEAVILVLVATIGGCFLVQMFQAQPDFMEVVSGLRPSLPPGALFVAIGILGATVMPHNLYLHSALVQTRRIGTDIGSRGSACKYFLLDAAIALNAAFFVNAAILILSAAVFHRHGVEVATIEEAHKLLPAFLGRGAPILFGIALLLRRTKFDPDGNAGRPDRDGGLPAPEDRALAAAPDHPVARPGSRGDRDRPGGGAFDTAASGSQPGGAEFTAFVRGHSLDPLHLQPAQHGGVRHPLVGAASGVGRGRSHRGPQWQARLRSGAVVGRAGGPVRGKTRARATGLAGGSGSGRAHGELSRACSSGSRSSRSFARRRHGGPRPVSISTGSRRSGRVLCRASVWRWSTDRPMPKSSIAP